MEELRLYVCKSFDPKLRAMMLRICVFVCSEMHLANLPASVLFFLPQREFFIGNSEGVVIRALFEIRFC